MPPPPGPPPPPPRCPSPPPTPLAAWLAGRHSPAVVGEDLLQHLTALSTCSNRNTHHPNSSRIASLPEQRMHRRDAARAWHHGHALPWHALQRTAGEALRCAFRPGEMPLSPRTPDTARCPAEAAGRPASPAAAVCACVRAAHLQAAPACARPRGCAPHVLPWPATAPAARSTP